MTARELYERVNASAAIDERRFFDCLNDSIAETAAQYGTQPETAFPSGLTARDMYRLRSFGEEIPLLPLYSTALADNILYLSGNGEHYKGEYLRKSREAWLSYWHETAHHRKLKRKGW